MHEDSELILPDLPPTNSDFQFDDDDKTITTTTTTRKSNNGIRAIRQADKETKDKQRAERERIRRLEREPDLMMETVDGAIMLEKDISISKLISDKLKKHQVEGVKFMWENCFESIDGLNKTSGTGCILAHCMGMGKTLQVISLIHTLVKYQDLTHIHHIIIAAPLNTLLNWKKEIEYWTRDCSPKLLVHHMVEAKTMTKRSSILNYFYDVGGILLMGYELMRTLIGHVEDIQVRKKPDQLLKKQKRPRKKITNAQRDLIKKTLLDPGADLVICDEGHILKNVNTSISKAMSLIKTLRRIVLTGTPLQNNLVEYYCMVNFIKPNILGSVGLFRNQFVNPIRNGELKDSSIQEVNLMKRRSFVLHQLLEGFVQRKDYRELAKMLPSKHEYVILCRLTRRQYDLYSRYLRIVKGVSKSKEVLITRLFSDYQQLLRVWSHPWALPLHQIRIFINQNVPKKQQRLEEEFRDFIDDDDVENDFTSSSESEIDGSRRTKYRRINSTSSSVSSTMSSSKRNVKKAKQRISSDDSDIRELSGEPDNGNDSDYIVDSEDEMEFDTTHLSLIIKRMLNGQSNFTERELEKLRKTGKLNWYADLCPTSIQYDETQAGKIMMLKSILFKCEERNEKILIFSQFLTSLEMITNFLKHWEEEDRYRPDGSKFLYRYEKDYLRIDGSTTAHVRQEYISDFNDDTNRRLRIFLLSTRAGGIGVNMVGANRVILFDASWNPSHDVQSIFRTYRFGQKKSVYIYRLIAEGTMEEKIYNKQITKISLADRVVDEKQVERNFSQTEITKLYEFTSKIVETEKEDDIDESLMLDETLKEKKRLISSSSESDSSIINLEDDYPQKKVETKEKDIEDIDYNNLMNVIRLTDKVPKLAPAKEDELLSEILANPILTRYIKKYFEHDSLLVHNAHEELTEAERVQAWADYRSNKNDATVKTTIPSTTGSVPIAPKPNQPTTSYLGMSNNLNNLFSGTINNNYLPIPEIDSRNLLEALKMSDIKIHGVGPNNDAKIIERAKYLKDYYVKLCTDYPVVRTLNQKSIFMTIVENIRLSLTDIANIILSRHIVSSLAPALNPSSDRTKNLIASTLNLMEGKSSQSSQNTTTINNNNNNNNHMNKKNDEVIVLSDDDDEDDISKINPNRTFNFIANVDDDDDDVLPITNYNDEEIILD
ncbi:hypothetical protein SNEBB_003154 [Seison nebaliae]|nr:hypothetical protein SNEBB_003154 [Seison nebaliae]